MSDTLIDHEKRLTRLEDRMEVYLPSLLARLEKLEGIADQARVDKEQAERREQAEIRRRLNEAETKLEAAGAL